MVSIPSAPIDNFLDVALGSLSLQNLTFAQLCGTVDIGRAVEASLMAVCNGDCHIQYRSSR